MFRKVQAFMEENEYFHDEHFLEFLEEDYAFELAEGNVSPVGAIITAAQLEDWVEEAAVEIEDEDPDPLLAESEEMDDEDFDDEDELGDGDDEE
jgi:hypothetical protein